MVKLPFSMHLKLATLMTMRYLFSWRTLTDSNLMSKLSEGPEPQRSCANGRVKQLWIATLDISLSIAAKSPLRVDQMDYSSYQKMLAHSFSSSLALHGRDSATDRYLSGLVVLVFGWVMLVFCAFSSCLFSINLFSLFRKYICWSSQLLNIILTDELCICGLALWKF